MVLCTWMSANRKHITKYTRQYHELYPNADILVLESSVADLTYRTDHVQHRRLRPALDVVLSHATSATQSGSRSHVLLHVFSNGGTQCAARLISGLPEEHRRTAFKTLVFDSCPGEATYALSARAMALSLPKHPLARLLGIPLIHLLLCMCLLIFIVTNSEDVVTRSKRRLNDPDFVDSKTARLYIFSSKDQLVLVKDVRSHAADAKRNGFAEVWELPFTDSGHCAHAMVHKELYWAAVHEVSHGLTSANKTSVARRVDT